MLSIYHSYEQIEITVKADQSSQIIADRIAHHMISDELKRLPINLPILSEESTILDYSERKYWNAYWLVDPLDGTKEFINRTGEFTINIALIENHCPTLGVVYLPVKGICYYADKNIGAYKKSKTEKEMMITTKKIQSTPAIVVVSHDEKSSELSTFLQMIGPHSLIRAGSSMKICLIAEGKADFYPRFFPTNEWDIAAAHSILLAAGGNIYDMREKTPLQYNAKPSLLNPNFIALSDNNKNFLDLF